MSGLIRDPNIWRTIVPKLRDPDVSDEEIISLLHDADRRLDDKFQVIDKSTFTPQLYTYSTLTTLTSTVSYIAGFRVGPWVQLNVTVRCTQASGGLGTYLTLPPQLPAKSDSVFSALGIGSYAMISNFTGVGDDTGSAFIYGPDSGAGVPSAVIGANNDGLLVQAAGVGTLVGYSVQYLTTLDAF